MYDIRLISNNIPDVTPPAQVRENDEKRTWLDLPPLIAPTKCSVLPLSSTPEFTPFVQELSAALRKLGIPNKVSGTVH